MNIWEKIEILPEWYSYLDERYCLECEQEGFVLKGSISVNSKDSHGRDWPGAIIGYLEFSSKNAKDIYLTTCHNGAKDEYRWVGKEQITLIDNQKFSSVVEAKETIESYIRSLAQFFYKIVAKG